MKRDFEEYYALPWTIKHYGEFDAIFSADELRLCYVSRPDTERKQAAMSYIIQCANLMPEAVRLLNEALRIIEKACIACANIDAYHCGLCGREETTREIKALLAELEGGAETE